MYLCVEDMVKPISSTHKYIERGKTDKLSTHTHIERGKTDTGNTQIHRKR
jgi:hypothetical protein